MQGHSIGALSKRTGVKVTTIRYYEGRGLLPDPGRTDRGQRRYGDAEMDRLSFIAHARQLGFDLDAVAELIALQETPFDAHGEAHLIATSRLAEVRDRIERLRRLEGELSRIVSACDGHPDGQPCRVLNALADHGACEHEH
ncbi:MerR family transcriptional regulator [Pseudoroseicyclus aestuarii]|uniref:DNA-binding transcriptional MerR regulator n=1 Tax=Pseudoroseicyclus aestuarii TaxID=1795041 RepID=A0A318SN33_9RHOB|nr:helix-turn-helix domain-containing protein [Pseudoroseicyclus aestuarii]PYE80604.1 DNA-binding transcriptional MerR regulator [Pseudoroseicyclus aestuarii]